MKNKNEIEVIYFELQGYLSEAPDREKGAIYENQTWIQFNKTIDELEKITSSDYSRYKIEPEMRAVGLETKKEGITTQRYRTLLGGLIFRLYGEYFSERQKPKIK